MFAHVNVACSAALETLIQKLLERRALPKRADKHEVTRVGAYTYFVGEISQRPMQLTFRFAGQRLAMKALSRRQCFLV